MKFKDLLKNVQPTTIVRLIVLVISLINLVLSMFGTYQIPGLSEAEQECLAVIITTIASAASYWYNNSWSENATTADKVLTMLKNNDISVDDLIDIADNLKDKIESRDKTK